MNNDFSTHQSIVISDRTRMELSGITDVDSFSENSVVAVSQLGDISIDGEELKVESFSAESGKLIINGKFDALCYFGRRSRKRGLFSKKTDER